MNEAEFAAWLHGSPDGDMWEGMQCLSECVGRDCPELVDCEEPWAGAAVPGGPSPPKDLTETAEGADSDGHAPEVIGMLADAIICQSCYRQFGEYVPVSVLLAGELHGVYNR